MRGRVSQIDSTEVAKILVVEDEAPLRTVLQMALQNAPGAKYDVRVAEDGIRALEEVRRDPPDLILLDVMMPGMTGYEVCRVLKENPLTSGIPVIFLTALTGDADRIKGLEAYGDDYVSKPFSPAEVLIRVRNQLRTRRAQLQSNPLTGLPGNVLIEVEITRRIAADERFAFIMIDLDRFKSYNDHYGYARGDTVIRFLASILHTQVGRLGATGDFVGHIGGDDFVVVTSPGRAMTLGNAIREEFDARVGSLYDEPDRRRGFITVLSSRQGGVTDFDLMSITIVIVTNMHHEIAHSAQVSDMAKEVKKRGKAMNGSVVLLERRTSPVPPVAAPGTTPPAVPPVPPGATKDPPVR
jgi:DNA-binding response OmpR family regulator